MIQRIQSVLLLLAALLNFAVLFLPVWTVVSGEAGSTATLYGMEIRDTGTEGATMGDNFLLLGHFLLVLLASCYLIGMIFLFKDRTLQLRMTYLGLGILLIQMIILVLLTQKLAGFVNVDPMTEGTVMFGFFAPVIAIILAWVAARMIKKDEELVRSADRLR